MAPASLRAATALALLAAVFAPAAAALPTPGVFCEPADTASGRLFPEADRTNDFVSYAEARCGLEALAEAYPDKVEIRVVTQSFGWKNAATQQHDRFDVFVVEVTDETSAVPAEAKRKIVFQLSIHGNEKGGREGGLRVIEDFARGLGLAAARPDLAAMLDDTMLVFVFPNPDGWTHEEAEYRPNCVRYFGSIETPVGCVDTQHFVRYNGNGVDLNRDSPTRGWYHEPYTAMSEPENVGLVNFLKNYTNVALASDIHGMLQPANANLPVSPFNPLDARADHLAPPDRGNFVLTMLPAGRQEPGEMAVTTTLAEAVKEKLNSDPYFAEWRAVPRPLGAWGGEFNDWGTVWDTIGYTDSGFTSDWYAQDTGLNTPGVDFELSYNHVTFDNYYPGLAQRINAYHVQIVRDIVEVFMDHAAALPQTRLDAQGRDTAVLLNPTVVTNADDPLPARGLEGWALENEADDAYDLAHADFTARPHDYWDDVRPYLANGRLDTLVPGDVAAGALAGYENAVVAGAAWRTLAGDAAAKTALRAWVEAGGTLLVTDEALQLLPEWALADEAGVDDLYAGFTDLQDRDHPLAAGVRGLARQLVEPVPIGYPAEGDTLDGAFPTWWVRGGKVEVVGTVGGPERVVVGEAALGAGRVVLLGAFLPGPTEAHSHPYGLDSYATTYTANQLVRNALGWSAEEGPDVPPPAAPVAQDAPTPAAGLVAAAFAAAGAAMLRRRVRG